MRLLYDVKRRRAVIRISLTLIITFVLIFSVKYIISSRPDDVESGPLKTQSTSESSSKSSSTGELSAYYSRFMELFNDVQTKGYLSKEGVPYHSIETLLVEAPDYGHLTTSEAFSYLTWLGATYGKLTGDWSYYKEAWDKTEKYIIPDPTKDQPGVEKYPPSKPAQYAPEADTPNDYPVGGSESAPVGIDPIADELEAAYGSKSIYQMHWLLDVDNWYKYGNHGDGTSRCSYINTYQRGPQESVWETVPHPCWEDFKWGAGDKGGFLSLFGKFGQPAKQWRYSSASDADARQVQASYWAHLWAKEQGKETDIKPYSEKASKMGDYLRYTLFDKYFRPIGVEDSQKGGTGYNSCHYLLSWYCSWGGDVNGSWSWRIGSSHNHQGYQNPVAAFALFSEPALTPKSPKAQEDWKKSLERQVELYQYLQSAEGAIAGGVTNSWQGKYARYPEKTSTFYGMAYDPKPVYHDPPSNQWFGFQAWSMERVMEYYYLTGDERIKAVCDKWSQWAIDNTKLNKDGTYEIPNNLEWTGQPDTWTGKPSENSNLHCKIVDYTNDVGIAAALAKALIYYTAAIEKHQNKLDCTPRDTAKELLDRMWKNYRDNLGVAVPEERKDYKRFYDGVYIPKDFQGTNGQGAQLRNGATFMDIRPDYKNDPDFKKIEDAKNNGTVPVMKYHRFWAQADIAMANAMYHLYIEKGKGAGTTEVAGIDSAIPEQPPATGAFNYGEALQKAIFFYECQRSGKIDPKTARLNWRGDSGMSDGKDVGVDLTGGWYDAGDHVKFNLPMAYSAAMLGWAVYEYKAAFEKSGQYEVILDNIQWATDYFIKCHTKPDEYYYQVGDGNKDHAWWGPAEVMQMARPSYKVDKTKPGSTVVAGTSAALAVASIVFKDSDGEYAKKCLKHAKELYAFADSTKSDAGYTAANGFYNSWSGFYDELSWAGVWLYLATGDSGYLKKAESYVSNWSKEPQSNTIAYKWAQCWDDVHHGAELLLAKIKNDSGIYKESFERHMDWWSNTGTGEHIKYTPKGLAWLDTWGSLRYATTEAFMASIYADWKGCDKDRSTAYKEFAKKQAEYALGSSGRSFVVGYGENPPEHPHHRTAHSSWADSQTVPQKHRHTLFGALVGGPDVSDGYNDSISDYTSNEVACDYNAGFVGLMAKMYHLYGGSPSKNFTGIEEKMEDEYFVEAGINASGTNFVEIKALLNNQSGWPAKVCENLSFKYFMDLSELKSSGRSVRDLKAAVNFGQGVKISEIKQFKGDIYYVTVDFSGIKIYPGGQSSYKKEVQFRISAPDGTSFVNFANDYSYLGLTSGAVTKTKYIPVYDHGNKVFGVEPGDASGRADNTASERPTDSENPSIQSSTLPSVPTAKPTQKPPAQTSENSRDTGSSGKLTLQYAAGNTGISSNSINPRFKLLNNGSTGVKLSDVKIRYYYTIDGQKNQSFWCDWSPLGNSKVSGKFIKMNPSKGGADYYLEISFANDAGSLEPGKEIEVQARFSKNDWTNYVQTGDYSFNASATGYTSWDRVTLHLGGKLVYGKQPS